MNERYELYRDGRLLDVFPHLEGAQARVNREEGKVIPQHLPNMRNESEWTYKNYRIKRVVY